MAHARPGILFAASVLLSLPFMANADSPADRDLNRIVHLKPDLAHGRDLFDTCAACHGAAGTGVNDGTVPAISAQHFKIIARALLAYRHNDRDDPRMRHFTDEHHLSGEHDIADVAAYVSRLQPTRSAQHGTGQHLVRGAELYQARCASCHGVKAEGDSGKAYPRLASQHYEYLLGQLGGPSGNPWRKLASDPIHSLQTLEPSDLDGLCDYLSRLQP